MKKRIISIFLIVSIIVSVCVVGVVTTSAASKLCVAPIIKSTFNRIESLNVNWNSVKNATYYTLWVRSSLTGKWVGIKTNNGRMTYANYDWKQPDEKVDLKVSAVDKNGIHSAYSAIKTVKNTSNVASILATPTNLKVENVGPLGRKVSWDSVKGAVWYRVFYKDANGRWLGKYNTKQTTFYDAYPTKCGDTYTVACITSNVTNWYPTSGYDADGVSITAKCPTYDEWAVGKSIKISGADPNAPDDSHYTQSVVQFYKDVYDTPYNITIPNGTIAKIEGIYSHYGGEIIDLGLRFASPYSLRAKIKYKNRVGYIDMQYCLIDVGEYVPGVTVALSLAAKNGNSYVGCNNKPDAKKICSNEVVNMFNYNNYYIEGISDYYPYKENRAWARYDSAKRLLLAQVYCLRKGYSLKIYDAYRPYADLEKMNMAWLDFAESHESIGSWVGMSEYSLCHSTGSGFDVSLVDVQYGKEVKMSTTMHDFSEKALRGRAYDSPYMSTDEDTLVGLMSKAGFRPSHHAFWWEFEDEYARCLGTYYKCCN